VEGPDADDLIRKRRPGRAGLAGGCDHLDDGLIVRVELEEFESLVCHRGIEQVKPAANAVMAAVRPHQGSTRLPSPGATSRQPILLNDAA
jgi:hypothetical protein